MAEVRSNQSRFCDLRTFLPYFPEPTGAVFDFTVENETHIRQNAVILCLKGSLHSGCNCDRGTTAACAG